MRNITSIVWLFGLGLWFAATASFANPLLERIASHIGQQPLLRVTFTQTKTMAALKRPLQSTGSLVYAKDAGVWWQLEQPLRVGYVLSETQVVELAADGTRKVRSAREVAGLAQMSRVFRALLGGNVAALQDIFVLETKGTEAAWEIVLTPKSAQMAQAISRITLLGGKSISSIQIQEASGDHTKIVLTPAQGGVGLTAIEMTAFGVRGFPPSRE
jgi:hypothetical protein